MNDAKIFFWPYDVFGYLLPGCIVTAAIVYFDPQGQAALHDLVEGKWAVVTVFVFISYIMGHLVAAASSWVVERVVVKLIWDYPARQMLRSTDGPWFRRNILWWFTAHCRQFPPYYRGRLIALYRETFGFPANNPSDNEVADGDNIFWTINDYLMQKAPGAYQHILHFVELYGLCRNGGMAFFMIGLLAWCRKWPIPYHPVGAEEVYPRG